MIFLKEIDGNLHAGVQCGETYPNGGVPYDISEELRAMGYRKVYDSKNQPRPKEGKQAQKTGRGAASHSSSATPQQKESIGCFADLCAMCINHECPSKDCKERRRGP